MKTIHLCRMFQAACPHCLPPIAGTWGVTSRGVCRRPMADDCISRAEPDGEQVVDLGDYLVVAGFRSKELFKAGPGVLYDILPAILADEWEILIKFARDYTERGIPWMVAVYGNTFKLVKKVSVVNEINKKVKKL